MHTLHSFSRRFNYKQIYIFKLILFNRPIFKLKYSHLPIRVHYAYFNSDLLFKELFHPFYSCPQRRFVFLDQELKHSHVDCYSFLLWGQPTAFKQASDSVAGRIVLQVNTHRLTESKFRFDVTPSRLLTETETMTSYHTEKCCHLVRAHCTRSVCPDPTQQCPPVPDL